MRSGLISGAEAPVAHGPSSSVSLPHRSAVDAGDTLPGLQRSHWAELPRTVARGIGLIRPTFLIGLGPPDAHDDALRVGFKVGGVKADELADPEGADEPDEHERPVPQAEQGVAGGGDETGDVLGAQRQRLLRSDTVRAADSGEGAAHVPVHDRVGQPGEGGGPCRWPSPPAASRSPSAERSHRRRARRRRGRGSAGIGSNPCA